MDFLYLFFKIFIFHLFLAVAPDLREHATPSLLLLLDLWTFWIVVSKVSRTEKTRIKFLIKNATANTIVCDQIFQPSKTITVLIVPRKHFFNILLVILKLLLQNYWKNIEDMFPRCW